MSLGIAQNVLTDRLNRLVDEDLFERVRYSERPERYEYRLTSKGRDLQVALTAPPRMGRAPRARGPPRLLRRRSDGMALTAALVPKGQKTIAPRDVELVPRDG